MNPYDQSDMKIVDTGHPMSIYYYMIVYPLSFIQASPIYAHPIPYPAFSLLYFGQSTP